MTAPSRFYRQHHEVEAPRVDDDTFRQAWRRRNRLDELLLDKSITPFEWRAAVEFRAAFERVLSAAWPPPLWLSATAGGRGDHEGAFLHRLDDLALLRALRAVLGQVPCGLIQACVVDDLSWAYLGRALDIDPKTARAWSVLSIKGLARLYQP